jgi:hypothetical protein
MKSNVQVLMDEITYSNELGQRLISYIETVDLYPYFEKALLNEKNNKLKHQLFIGKVSEVIGNNKTLELLKEVKEIINKNK